MSKIEPRPLLRPHHRTARDKWGRGRPPFTGWPGVAAMSGNRRSFHCCGWLELSLRFSRTASPGPPPAPDSRRRHAGNQNQSHLRTSYRLDYDLGDAKARAAATICAMILGGTPSSRFNDEIRQQRGLCYSISAGFHASADVATLNLGACLASANCVEAYTRMREIVAELHALPRSARRKGI